MIDLYDDVRNELPDLIMYDKSPLYPKFMIEYFMQEMKRERLKKCKIFGYDTALHMDSDYPNQFERQFMEFNLSMKKLFRLFNYLNMRRVNYFLILLFNLKLVSKAVFNLQTSNTLLSL